MPLPSKKQFNQWGSRCARSASPTITEDIMKLATIFMLAAMWVAVLSQYRQSWRTQNRKGCYKIHLIPCKLPWYWRKPRTILLVIIADHKNRIVQIGTMENKLNGILNTWKVACSNWVYDRASNPNNQSASVIEMLTKMIQTIKSIK